jgi:nickel-dependent lactate racemase
VTGAIVQHYFGGFGGGRKSIVPGLASATTIAGNHALNLHPTDDRLDPAVRIGTLDGNPVAEDMLEAAQFVPVEFILNTVLNRDARIAAVFCGELDAAHRAGCAFARDVYASCIEARADLVIAASAHTRNFVQSHKALYNAYQAVQPNGRIVLAAPCAEGLGGERFSKWLALGDRAEIFAALRARSEINGQTALSTLEKSSITRFVTELPEADVHRLGGRKSPTLQHAIDTTLAELAHDGIAEPAVYLMPSAAYTVPVPAC